MLTESESLLWTESLISLAVSILFMAGIALIEPLFVELHDAEELLKHEKKQLQQVVQHNEDDLRVARQIQENLFPEGPPLLDKYEIAGASLPAEWASGDYFDYIPMHDGAWAVVVADVSGHGIGPALLMSETRAFLRSLAQTHSDVGQILTLANRAIAQDVEEGRFVTLFLARLDPQSRRLEYTSAGHNGYLLNGRGEPRVLDRTGMALGVNGDSVIDTAPPVDLQSGDVLLLLTDGIIETHSSENELFGEERLFDVVREHREKSSEQIVEAIFTAAREFSGNVEQRDDNTAVVVKVT